MLYFLYKFLIEAKNLEKNKNMSLIVRIYGKMIAVRPAIRRSHCGGIVNQADGNIPVLKQTAAMRGLR